MSSKIPTPSSNHQLQLSRIGVLQPNQSLKKTFHREMNVSTKNSVSSYSTNTQGKMPGPKLPTRPPKKNLKRSISMASLGNRSTVQGMSAEKRPKIAPTRKPSDVTASSIKNVKMNSGSSKRPAWDLKGRLLDMEKVLKENCDKIKDYDTRMGSLESEKNILQKNLIQTKTHSDVSQEEINRLEEQLRNVRNEKEHEKLRMEATITELTNLNSSFKERIQILQEELSIKSKQSAALQAAVSQLESSKAEVEARYTETKLLLETKTKQVEELEAIVDSQTVSISEMTNKIMEGEMLRRKLHNELQELKGNIQVYCRLRPLIGEEIANNGGSTEILHINVLNEKSIELVKKENLDGSIIAGLRNQNCYEFSFDKVFSANVSQKEVYEEVSQMVQSVLDGYNVCIFAYGQTGSGKTFTMEGSYNDDEMEGIIPRTIKHIFASIDKLKDKGWEYEIKVSFLEIYNETIRDLLANPKVVQNVHYEIHLVDNKKTHTFVSNAKVINVEEVSQIYKLLEIAQQHRAVAATKMNDRSSRSHSIFQIKLEGRNSKIEASCEGTLNLVDLAGSERLKNSGHEGTRLIETQSINKSLANLGNVIMALAQKQKHIPYRNSKLTHLLQNSLGGNSKTLMFVNISPLSSSFNETLNSLRFATKVNECQIGTAVKQVKK